MSGLGSIVRRAPHGGISKGSNRILKRGLIAFGFCLLLLQPISTWALDGGENWRNLSPQERENVIRNYQRWQNLSPRDKDYLRDEWYRWQSLPKDRRDKLRRRYDELYNSSPKGESEGRDRSGDKKSRRWRDRDRE